MAWQILAVVFLVLTIAEGWAIVALMRDLNACLDRLDELEERRDRLTAAAHADVM